MKQKGVIEPSLLIVLTALGISIYFLMVAIVPLASELLNALYPKPPGKAQTTNWKSYQESLQSKELSPVYEILEIIFSYDLKKPQPLFLDKLTVKNGYPPQYLEVDSGYTLKILDKQGVVFYSLNFEIPHAFSVPPPIDPKTPYKKDAITLNNTFALTIPWYKDGSKLQIFDPKNNLIITQVLTNITKLDNIPDFQSIKGEDALKLNKKQINLDIFSKVQAQTNTGDGKLDILFVADEFPTSDNTRYQNLVNDAIAFFLNIEPFKSRASQIQFHTLPNTLADAGCTLLSTGFIDCSPATTISVVNITGAPYDQIVVLVDNPNWGGGNSGMVSYLLTGMGQYLSNGVTHELGHGIGALQDEYLVNAGYPAYLNCYNGTPPNPAWANVVASNDYYLECNQPNYYRSSQNSLMKSINTNYFNPISQKYLNEGLDFFGRLISITNPTNGSSVSGVVTVTVNSTIPNLKQVSLTNGPIVFDIDTSAPFQFTWDTTNLPNGSHTRYVRGEDILNRIYDSLPITVNVFNQAPTPTPTPIPTPSPTPTPTPDPSLPQITSITHRDILTSNNQPLVSNTGVSLVNVITVNLSSNTNVTKVELLVDGVLTDTDTTSPYQPVWDTSPLLGTGSHSLELKVYNSTTNSSFSVTPVWVLGSRTLPTPPTNLRTTSVTHNSVQLSWDPPSNSPVSINGYYIIRNKTSIGIHLSTTPSFTDLTTSPSTTYEYYVVSRDQLGQNSGLSNKLTVTTLLSPTPTPSPTPTVIAPQPPTITKLINCLTNLSTNSNLVNISWVNNSSPVSFVDISNNSFFTTYYNKAVSATTTSTTAPTGFTISAGTTALTINPNTTYYVRLFNGLHSPVTSLTSFLIPLCSTPTPIPTPTPLPTPTPSPTPTPIPPTPLPTPSPTPLPPTPTPFVDNIPPSTPTNLLATSISTTQINLSWGASTDNVGVVGYKVYRSIGGGNSIEVAANVSSTSYGDTNLTPSTTYSYFVKAFDAANNISASSNIASASTKSVITISGITGRVLDSNSTQPIPGVKVTYYIGGVKTTTLTDSNGLFNLVNIPAGNYSINLYQSLYKRKVIQIVVNPSLTTNQAVVLIKI